MDEIALMREIGRLQEQINALRTIEIPSRLVTPFDSAWVGTEGQPLTSTSWDGDAKSTTSKALLDLSAVFGAPAGIKAVLFNLAIRDSGSSSGAAYIAMSPNSTASEWASLFKIQGLPNDVQYRQNVTVPCNADGDVYIELFATGSGTLDVWIEIWGYWI